MKKRITAKLLALALLTGTITACGSQDVVAEVNLETSEIPNDEFEDIESTLVEVETVEKEELTPPSKSLSDLEVFPVIRATDNVNIRDKGYEGEIQGILYTGCTLPYLGKDDNNNYIVEYNGATCYVCSDYAVEDTITKFPYEMEYVARLEKDTTLYLNNEGTSSVIIPAGEFVEVYSDTDGYLLVETTDYKGFMFTEDLTILEGTFVVVDISSQHLSLYSDSKEILDTEVVTGKDSTPTRVGDFEIYQIAKNKYLMGKYFVNSFYPFDGGIGLHDAEYYTEENGFHHGWRTKDEFGSDNYHTKGSHGCVNMKHDDLCVIDEYCTVGTKVYVKE